MKTLQNYLEQQLDEPIRQLGLKMNCLANEKQIQKQSISKYFKRQFDQSNPQDKIDSVKNSKSQQISEDNDPINKVQPNQQQEQTKPDILNDDEVNGVSNQIISGANSKNNQCQVQQQQQFIQKLQAQPKSFKCPICNQEIDCKGNNTVMNKHIDRCINQQNVIVEQSDESNKNQSEQKMKLPSKIQSKPQKIINFFKK